MLDFIKKIEFVRYVTERRQLKVYVAKEAERLILTSNPTTAYDEAQRFHLESVSPGRARFYRMVAGKIASDNWLTKLEF